ncbi:MAG: hypothetical protein VX793_00710 [Pseudomonadota bacterium]|nr:hypothetical protein [Pseudomonadota bacterium]
MLTYIETHRREAAALFQRRVRLLESAASPLAVLQTLDWRLSANLAAVSSQGGGHLDASLRPPALFVETWALLQREGQGGLAEVDGLYSDLDPDQRQALAQAVALSSVSGETRQPSLQAKLLERSEALAMDEAEVADHDPLLARWLAYQDEAGAQSDRFQSWYWRRDYPQARCQALQAGLVRRDSQAISAAREEGDAPVIAMLLALNGDPSDRLLVQAFYGSLSSARQVLDAMHEVSRCEEAAQAWFWLTGDVVPRKARMQSVGGKEGCSRETLPDADAAAQAWKATQWQGDGRYFFGHQVTDSSLAVLAGQWCGQITSLVVAQQSWLAGKRVLCESGWQFHKGNGKRLHA